MRDTGDWFARQLAHVRACVAEAERSHSPEELRLAELALAEDPCSPQRSLFAVPPNAGVMTGGQPEPSGLADTQDLGA